MLHVPVLLLAAVAAYSQRQRDAAPMVGDLAPAVKAEILGSKSMFDMATNRGKRPTVLIFGSCT